jgi:DNA-binding NarL/FixJ family response regulator
MRKLRILIADDQTLMRDGLRTILELEDDMEVVGTAENGREACDMTAALRPDLVLMDVKMPIMNGVASTRWIKRHYPETNVLILTTYDTDDNIIEALAHGACGFLLKDMPGEKLIAAVREAASGQTMLPSAVAAKLAARLRMVSSKQEEEDRMGPVPQFTSREKEIIHYIIRNYSNKEIAEALKLTEGTVKNYITVIYGKIGTSERLKAITFLKKMFQEEDEP